MTLTKGLRKRFYILLAAAAAIPGAALSQETAYELGGHTKGRVLGQAFPDNSAFHQLVGSSSLDVEGDLRLNLEIDRGRWTFDAAYQFFGGYGDLINPAGLLPGDFIPRLPNDDRRFFNLTHTIDDEGKFVALQRLDRLWVGYASDKAVFRLGRQALSWGNGLVFSPLDIVNPFDPTAVDTEYKAGDDMLYVQYLQDSGNDVQAAYVVRRNILSGDPKFDESTVAIKYHGITGNAEFDLLVAKNYGDTTLAIGGNHSMGVVRFGAATSFSRMRSPAASCNSSPT